MIAGAALWLLASGAAPTAAADQQATTTAAADQPAAAPADDSLWVATLSAGVLARDGDAARPYGAAGISRRIGRTGYVRAALTGYRSVTQQADAVLPSRFALASIGAGLTAGRWFVDGYATGGRQFYGDVTTATGTRPSQVGSGSGVWGAGLDGGRYIALGRRLFLTPSLAVQFSANKALRQAFSQDGAKDVESEERAITGSATLRLDRYVGHGDRHLVGISVSRVQTSNGATALATGVAGPTLDGSTADLRSVADGWFVAGASASLRVGHRLWIDAGATRTVDARSGDYSVATLGLRRAF